MLVYECSNCGERSFVPGVCAECGSLESELVMASFDAQGDSVLRASDRQDVLEDGGR